MTEINVSILTFPSLGETNPTGPAFGQPKKGLQTGRGVSRCFGLGRFTTTDPIRYFFLSGRSRMAEPVVSVHRLGGDRAAGILWLIETA